MSGFRQAVYQVVTSIPPGQVMTYGAVAKQAGYPRAARAVGTLMAQNLDPTIPCHRVIRSDGSLGNYNRGGTQAKLQKLQSEGYIPQKKSSK